MMASPILEKITMRLPAEPPFSSGLSRLLENLGRSTGNLLEFHCSAPGFLPRICLQVESGLAVSRVDFSLSNGQSISVKIENTTGKERQSPHIYGYVPLDEMIRRLDSSGLALVGLDHVGFNLPWFGPGLHPRIAFLRSQLASACLYHRFPTGEAWDFILPGDMCEIQGRKEVDYSLPRTPKFELVSFEKSSRPLIQFDVSLAAKYETLVELFPEALPDPQIGNCWVYLQNGFPMDVCLVLNLSSPQDWSKFFKGSWL